MVKSPYRHSFVEQQKGDTLCFEKNVPQYTNNVKEHNVP